MVRVIVQYVVVSNRKIAGVHLPPALCCTLVVQGRRFSGSLHCAKELVKNYGISSLGTGMLVNGWREVLFCTIYFGVYENVKARLKKTFKETTGSERELLAILLSGGLSGMISWFTTFPLDSLKSNIQGQPLENLRTPQRASALKLVVNRFKQVGIKGFYSGVYPAVVRACIVSSTRFTSFEFALQTLAKLDI
jgi:solute carrier family 25 carnitine/acylcarnitine transporter 20/29